MMVFNTRHLFKSMRSSILLIVVIVLLPAFCIAQDKLSLQVKVFDQDLKPFPNIQIAFNNLDYFAVGSKGTAIIELPKSEIPITTIRVKDESFEAASWNLSKGTIEIIVRVVSYKTMHLTLQFADGKPGSNLPITFHGQTTINLTSDQSGKVDLPVSIHEDISAGQFNVNNVVISDMKMDGDNIVLFVERLRPKEPVQQDPVVTKPIAPKFDITRLDSIRSLSEFYEMFRNISINLLDHDSRALVDEKFRQLVAQRQDSIRAGQGLYIRDISDSSMVIEDIRNLLKQATAESSTLRRNREDFENKIVVISSKLQRGVINLSQEDRSTLLRDIDMLEQLLTENESQFYENHNDYREIINTLREKYLDIEQLQTRLSETERLREEEQKELRQRLIGIGTIVVVFGFLIILLMTFSSRLRRQKKSLEVANQNVEQINENLEEIVAKRTRLLEETNKELDTFLYRASHDLRSPVQSMMGLFNIIEHIGREEMAEHLQMATTSMSRVINKLVAISEIAQESRNVKTTSVLEVINQVRNKQLVAAAGVSAPRDLKSIVVRRRPVQFEVDCPESIDIHTSPSLLEVVLTNLIENAVFFSNLKKSDEPIIVQVKARMQEGKLVLSVYDNGVGISNHIRPKIFDMFFTGNEGSKGSGLGLYTVKKCMIALHGTVTYESEEGKYTRFTVVVPPHPA